MKKDGQKTAAASLRFMYGNFVWIWATLLALPLALFGAPQPPQGKPNPLVDENLRQIKTLLTDMRHEVNNHEAEIKVFDNRLQNQENLIESMRQQLIETLQASQDVAAGQRVNLESKVSSLETLVQGLITDMKQLKVQANDSVSILSQYKQKIADLEKIIASQAQHMKSLENGLQSLVDVFQAKEAVDKVMTKSGDYKKYKVQSGDSLEKIARLHNVSIQALREANHLTNDKIVVGQNLKIP